MQHCERCHTFTENTICDTCLDEGRDAARLCVVETPADQAALERTGAYKGYYYVLMGRLSPLDGIGPRDIGVQQLLQRASDGVVQEVILATNFTAEGEATAHVISEALQRRGIGLTRLARGVPIGSEPNMWTWARLPTHWRIAAKALVIGRGGSAFSQQFSGLHRLWRRASRSLGKPVFLRRHLG